MKVYLNQHYDLLPFSEIDGGAGGRGQGGGGGSTGPVLRSKIL